MGFFAHSFRRFLRVLLPLGEEISKAGGEGFTTPLLFSPPLVFPFPVHVTWKVLRSLGNPCGVELALVNSSLGMQL